MDCKNAREAHARLAWTVLAVAVGGAGCSSMAGRSAPHVSRSDSPVPLASVSASDDRVRLVAGEHNFQDVAGDVPCWSLATQGLAAFGQKELVFFVRQDAGITLDHALNDLNLFAAGVAQLAAAGRLVDVGGYSEMGNGLLGRRDFTGVLYAAPQPVDGLALPRPHLIAILVTTDELHTALQYGHQRITARLGLQSRYYPVPPWVDPHRPSVAFAGDSTTVLEGTHRLFVDGYVHQDVSADSAPVVLELAPGATASLGAAIAELPEDRPLVLLLRTSSSWDGMLVWRPGVDEIEAINPEGGPAALLGGNHLAFIPLEEAAPANVILEDGYAVRLGADDWRGVRNALASGQDLVVGSPPALEIRWRSEVEVSQVDGREYRAPGGWERAEPEQQTPPEGRLEAVQIVLLIPDDVVAERTGVEPLSDFITAVREAAGAVVKDAADATARQLAFRILLQPGKRAECEVGLDPDDPALHSALAAACAGVPPPAATGDVPFELQLRILPRVLTIASAAPGRQSRAKAQRRRG